MKNFKLPADQIKPLIEGLGGCFATDRITVDGMPVGYMYREEPGFDCDSGWRFLAGDETQDYIDDTKNTSIYDVNTIANYDSTIISFLNASAGTAFERTNRFSEFVEVPFDSSDE